MAAVRLAVRGVLADLPTWSTVLVACSGGADSLALAAALAFEAPGAGLRAGAVIVDHRLQEGSADVAAQAAQACRGLGLDPVDVVRVAVPDSPTGPEDAARTARYAALADAATRHTAALVLLGHTRDDQAEQVLLGLARGSGARSLSGMPPSRGPYARPLLGVTRAQTEAACREAGLEPWRDPHNSDPTYARVRARAALGELDAVLGPGLGAALARSADLLRDDADLLDELAAQARADVDLDPAGERVVAAQAGAGDVPAVRVAVVGLAALPPALRRRVWRIVAAEAGARALSAAHVALLDGLVLRWHGQGAIDLPGGVVALRVGGTIQLGPRPADVVARPVAQTSQPVR